MTDPQSQLGTKPASLRLLAKCAKAILWKINERRSEVPQWLISELVVLRGMLDTSADAAPQQARPAPPPTPNCPLCGHAVIHYNLGMKCSKEGCNCHPRAAGEAQGEATSVDYCHYCANPNLYPPREPVFMHGHFHCGLVGVDAGAHPAPEPDLHADDCRFMKMRSLRRQGEEISEERLCDCGKMARARAAHPESRGAAKKELLDTSFTFDEHMILWQILRKAKGASFEMNWANEQVIAVEEKIMPSTVSAVMAAPPSSPGAPQTRFNDFYDDSHPFQVWWQRFGQFIMAGGGRTESIWAARGWIAREQMACGVEVTGDSMHERASSLGAGTETK